MLRGALALSGTGTAAADILDGSLNSAALNVLTGLGGNDTYVVGVGDTVVEAPGGGTDSVQSWTIGLDLAGFPNVENAGLTGSLALNLTGSAGANVLNGETNSAAQHPHRPDRRRHLHPRPRRRGGGGGPGRRGGHGAVRQHQPGHDLRAVLRERDADRQRGAEHHRQRQCQHAHRQCGCQRDRRQWRRRHFARPGRQGHAGRRPGGRIRSASSPPPTAPRGPAGT